MNSRSVNDNLVNFSTDLATTLSQLDSKEPLLSFPFDHLYACSDTDDPRQTLHLKEVEISTHCVDAQQEKHVTQRLASLENQNKKLKDLVIYHLDLIQQQNVLMSNREKAFQALKQENDTLRKNLLIANLRKKSAENHDVIPLPLHEPATATVTSPPVTAVQPALNIVESPSSSHQTCFDDFNEYFCAQHPNNESLLKYYNTAKLEASLFRTEYSEPDFPSLFSPPLTVPSILEGTSLDSKVLPQPEVMIDSKRLKKDNKNVEANSEPKYTVTTKSGNPKISRNRKRPTGIGSFSRMPKSKTPKVEKNITYDEATYNSNVNKQSKMTYGKSKQSKYGYTALQERLQLIEPTPTGEDPYQIGEAEMREQSPIPKLMLQKTNHGRMRVRSESVGGVTSTITSTTPSRRIYGTLDTTSNNPKVAKIKTNVLNNVIPVQITKEASEDEQEIDVEEIDGETDLRTVITPKSKHLSLSEYSYGETSTNFINLPLFPEFPDLFEPGPVNEDSSSARKAELAPNQPVTEKTRKRRTRTTSLAGPLCEEISAEPKRAGANRGRKRANSTAIPIKRAETTTVKAPAKPRARRATRAKKVPVPGMTTKKPYHTCTGDPDLSWYLGLDPDVKKDDCDPLEGTSSMNVEVPRWRTKNYTPTNDHEGTEDLVDKVFKKRHQKLEAEERRQLRWYNRLMREQQKVERLRQRQRDSNSVQAQPREYTVLPQPLRDLQYIEMTDILPVDAFGEQVPDLSKDNFKVPWVRVSKASKKTKRSETLH